jgi:hypothetical protein
MTLTVAYPHIEKQDTAPARLSRLPRIRVAQIVMDTIAYGWSAEETCRQHPVLKPAEVYSALRYYHDHKDDIDEEIKDEWDEAERAKSAATKSPFYVRMKGKGTWKLH